MGGRPLVRNLTTAGTISSAKDSSLEIENGFRTTFQAQTADQVAEMRLGLETPAVPMQVQPTLGHWSTSTLKHVDTTSMRSTQANQSML